MGAEAKSVHRYVRAGAEPGHPQVRLRKGQQERRGHQRPAYCSPTRRSPTKEEKDAYSTYIHARDTFLAHVRTRYPSSDIRNSREFTPDYHAVQDLVMISIGSSLQCVGHLAPLGSKTILGLLQASWAFLDRVSLEACRGGNLCEGTISRGSSVQGGAGRRDSLAVFYNCALVHTYVEPCHSTVSAQLPAPSTLFCVCPSVPRPLLTRQTCRGGPRLIGQPRC